MRATIGDSVKLPLGIEEGQLVTLDFNQHPLTGIELAGFSYLDSLTHIPITAPL